MSPHYRAGLLLVKGGNRRYTELGPIDLRSTSPYSRSDPDHDDSGHVLNQGRLAHHAGSAKGSTKTTPPKRSQPETQMSNPAHEWPMNTEEQTWLRRKGRLNASR